MEERIDRIEYELEPAAELIRLTIVRERERKLGLETQSALREEDYHHELAELALALEFATPVDRRSYWRRPGPADNGLRWCDCPYWAHEGKDEF